MVERSARATVAVWVLLALLSPVPSLGPLSGPFLDGTGSGAGDRCTCSGECGESCCCLLAHHGAHPRVGGGDPGGGDPHWTPAGAVVAERCGGCQGVASSASGRRSSSAVAVETAPAVELPSALHPPIDGDGPFSFALGSAIAPRGPPTPSARP